MDAVIHWIANTRLSSFVIGYGWVWPTSETLHFCGLVLMAGTVGMFDLRVLGLGKGIAIGELHRLLRWGVLGFGISVATGILFLAGTPDQYFYNLAFQAKVICLALLGTNVVMFYKFEFRQLIELGPYDDTPTAAKWMAGVSLTLIIAIMCCGRMLTFFRPPPNW